MPRCTSAFAHDGVRPANAHGSSVTNAARLAISPFQASDCIAAASACGSPGAPVNPRAITRLSPTMTQPTGGLGRQPGNALRLSDSAAAMKSAFARSENAVTSTPGLHRRVAALHDHVLDDTAAVAAEGGRLLILRRLETGD